MTLLKKTKNYKYTSSNPFLHPALPLPDIFCEILLISRRYSVPYGRWKSVLYFPFAASKTIFQIMVKYNRYLDFLSLYLYNVLYLRYP